MNEIPVIWCPRFDPEEYETEPYLIFELEEETFAVDSDQVILRVILLERNGEEVDRQPAYLKQFGGASLMLQMLDLDLEAPLYLQHDGTSYQLDNA